MVAAAVPITILLVAGLLARAGSAVDTGRRARVFGASGAGLAFLVTLLLWKRGFRGAMGTLDADPFSLYCTMLLLGTLLVVLVMSQVSSVGISRLLLSAAPMLFVVSTRDLLWIGVGLTVLIASLLPEGVTVGVGLAGATLWAGAGLLVLAGGGSDLAVIGQTPSGPLTKLGIVLTVLGVGLVFVVLNRACWTRRGNLAMRGYLSVGAWTACIAALARVAAWLDVSFGAFSLVVGVLGTLTLMGSSLGVLLSNRLARFCFWLVLSQAGFTLVALELGVEGLLPLLLHLAAGTTMLITSLLAIEGSSNGSDIEIESLADLGMGRSARIALALAWLSFASLPPFPGFIARFPMFIACAGRETYGLLAVLLLATLLVAAGCTRWIPPVLKAQSTSVDRRLGLRARALALLALGSTIALGLLPEAVIQAASRAAAGLF